MARAIKKGTPVVVRWLDHKLHTGNTWPPTKEPVSETFTSRGIVVDNTADYPAIAHSVTDNGTYYDVLVVLWPLLLSVKPSD